MKILTPPDNAWQGKRLLLRLDLNVPLTSGRIADDFKLKAALPTIRRFGAKAALIIVTHIGEPKTKADRTRLSTKPVAGWLRRRLGSRVGFASLDQARNIAADMEIGDILVLENIRFEKGETTNDSKLAKRLAALADCMVNDAFAVSHRTHASVSAIASLLPVFAGPLLSAEVKHLEAARQGKRPVVVVIGGAKISTKLGLIKKFSAQTRVLTGGGIANTLLLAANQPIGCSLAERDNLVAVRRITTQTIGLPIDCVVLGKNGRAVEKKITDVLATDRIIDIGSKTIKQYLGYLRTAKTIIWNGPVGLIEDKRGKKGTLAIAKAIAANRRALSVIGGGETLSALPIASRKNISWISTGGGATLSYLAGELMPGLKKIIRR